MDFIYASLGRLGDFLGKYIEKGVEDLRINLHLKQNLKPSASEESVHALSLFMREFLKRVFYSIFKNTNTSIKVEIKSEIINNKKIQLEFNTHGETVEKDNSIAEETSGVLA